MSALIAYPGGAAQKEALVASLEAHAAADRIEAGHYWSSNKGCSVACALQSLGKIYAAQIGDHDALGQITGYGEMLAMIQDAIFEGLPDVERQQFSIAFHKAIPVGADVSLVGWKFLDRLLTRLFEQPYTASVAYGCKPVRNVIAAKARGERVDDDVASSANCAAVRALGNAVANDCAYAVRDAACVAAYAADAVTIATFAADAVKEAADAASDAADTVEASFAAAEAEYRAQASDLLELLANAPVPNMEDDQ